MYMGIFVIIYTMVSLASALVCSRSQERAEVNDNNKEQNICLRRIFSNKTIQRRITLGQDRPIYFPTLVMNHEPYSPVLDPLQTVGVPTGIWVPHRVLEVWADHALIGIPLHRLGNRFKIYLDESKFAVCFPD